MVTLARSGLVVLVVLLANFLSHPPSALGPWNPASASAQPFGPGIHRTYWLNGTTLTWNKTSQGPPLVASDGDTISILLSSADPPNTHDWYLDFNSDLTVDSNEIPTRSPDFSCASYCRNFTITLFLGQGNYTSGGQTHVGVPHGGLFTYRCQYHSSMQGDFRFNAGPVASFTHTPSTPLVGHPVTFDASSSWPTTGSTFTSYSWNFGDSNTTSSASSTISHTYAANNTYTVTLTTTDTALQTATTTGTVTVLNPPPSPFDYKVTTAPSNPTVIAGVNTTIDVNVTLVSGTPENVSLTLQVTPSSTAVQASLNVTSGFPTFHARILVYADVSSLCDPSSTSTCNYLSTVQYSVKLIALSDTGVAHNSTVVLNIIPTAHTIPPLGFLFFAFVGAVIAIGIVAVFLFVRSRRKTGT